ncbi:hypothetical protein ACFOWA_12995 [Pedobacter lithocola]|uniref:Lipoprotein n=1 Tax=Pedobacter lithocola TaxID=1908239 RepID=A0ABV8PBV7_9SPHI
MKIFLIISIMLFAACKREEPSFNKSLILQQCIDSLSKMPDLKYMDSSQVVLLYNDIIKDSIDLRWKKNLVKFEKESLTNSESNTYKNLVDSKKRKLLINKISYSNTRAEVQILFLEIQANYIFYFQKNSTDSIYKITEVGQVDF